MFSLHRAVWYHGRSVWAVVGVAFVVVLPVHAEAVKDTVVLLADPDVAVTQRLSSLLWDAAAFEVRTQETPGGEVDAVVWFASPTAQQDEPERVPLLWYRSRTPDAAPAVLIVHSLHPQTPVAKMMARLLSEQGVHALIIQMPGYGHRRVTGRLPGAVALERSAQAVADIRRARDVVAALPDVSSVSLAGISLGGFAAATAASIDNAFENVFLLVTGAQGFRVLSEGSKDARLLYLHMQELGYGDAELTAMLDVADPVHFAHRLDPLRTWLYSGVYDVTVPRFAAERLAEAAGLPAAHHIWMGVNHYTAIVALPEVARRIVEVVRAQGE